MCHGAHRSERTPYESQFFQFIMRVPEHKHRSLGLVTAIFTCSTILPTPSIFTFCCKHKYVPTREFFFSENQGASNKVAQVGVGALPHLLSVFLK